jgi:DNA replication and repair protein RecF
MRLDRLSLTGFRSYGSLDVEFAGGPHVVVGPNAAGKTNLLESLVVLGTGRSHRAANDAELISWESSFARLEARVSAAGADPGGGAAAELEVVLARTTTAGRKRVRVNGVARRAPALRVALPIVLFAPEDMLLVVGSPSLRRQVLDGLVLQLVPAAASAMATYTRGLVQRNNLLRAVRDSVADPAELRFWSDVIADEGGRIVEWRRETLRALAVPLAGAHGEIAPEEERLDLAYLSNAEPLPGEDATAALRRRLAETAEKEVWNGATLVGPHRDDVSFLLGGRDMTTFSSRGQQRTAILALKLAQLDLLRHAGGHEPLLLLDDVFSELDPERRAHLVRRIGELPQAFVTTTTLDDLDPALVAASTAWQVIPGRLEPARVLGRSA